MNRGARQQPIFTDDEDCQAFIDLLGELPLRFGVRVHGYALMPNHFHLMLESTRGQLSRAVQHVAAGFTRLLNHRHGWDGPVFRGRFRSRLVLDDRYWMHLLAYLHLNAVKAGLARSVDDAHWTSHAAYAGRTLKPSWLTTADLTALHGGTRPLLDYIESVRRKERQPPETFDEAALWTREKREPPRAQAQRGSDLLAEFQSRTGADLDALREGRRERRNQVPRWVAAFWLEAGGMAQARIGTVMSAQPAQVSRWIRRVRGVHQGGADPLGAEISEVLGRLPPPPT
jgi:REP element-mobilizing transposase RayT